MTKNKGEIEMDIMTIAWAVAREGQKRHGGKVKEYFAESLRLAWKVRKGEPIEKVSNKIEVELPEGSRNHKTWVAEITGTHPQFNFDRTFVDLYGKPEARGWFAKLEEGKVYDTSNLLNRRAFVTVKGGKIVELEYKEVAEMFA